MIVDRPMSAGELADRMVTLLVRNWRVVSPLLLAAALGIGAFSAITRRTTGTAIALGVVLHFAINAFAGAGIVFAVAEPDSHRTIGAAVRRASRSYLRALGTSIAAFVSVVPLGFIAALPAALISVVLPLSFTMRIEFCFALVTLTVGPIGALLAGIAFPIALLEDRTPFDAVGTAFRRAKSLGFRSSWLLGMAIFLMVYGPAWVLNTALEALPRAASLPLAAEIALELIGDAMSLGLGMVLSTLIAVETRIRTDGHDLEVALQSATSASATLTTPGVSTSQ